MASSLPTTDNKMVMKLGILFSIFLSGIGMAKAQQPKSSNASSLLWKISGKGLSHPSYLFGTIHLICPDQLHISKGVKKAISASKQIYLELDMDDSTMTATIQKRMLLPGDNTLQDLFTPQEYEDLANFFTDSLHIDIAMFDRFRPIALVSLLSARSLSCAVPASYETSFVQLAHEQDKPVKGLETVEQQLAALDELPASAKEKMIMEWVKNFTKEKANMQQLMKAYLSNNLDSIYHYIAASPDIAMFKEDLLDKRNQRWAIKMKSIMAEESTFFAVGAGHLGGTEGVIALLIKEGYSVKPLAN